MARGLFQIFLQRRSVNLEFSKQILTSKGCRPMTAQRCLCVETHVRIPALLPARSHPVHRTFRKFSSHSFPGITHRMINASHDESAKPCKDEEKSGARRTFSANSHARPTILLPCLWTTCHVSAACSHRSLRSVLRRPYFSSPRADPPRLLRGSSYNWRDAVRIAQ